MSKGEFCVAALGNAIVDVIVKVENSFLVDNSIEKGVMTVIDADQAEALYNKLV
ncbi:MAG TPA: adenosine kinase, partial [Alphaproteobacteria bacterium]|nr:adenosine kinase [Alphaproteobacteria bacterium]